MSLFGSGRREGLLAVLTLLLMSIALHAPGLFLGEPRAPSMSATWSERAREQYTNADTLVPAMLAAGVAVRNGESPLWNTTSHLGEPFLTSGAPVLYPPFWLLMLDNGTDLLDFLMCLHTFLAAMCMFRFCRIVPLSRYVSFLAGSLYGLGWFMTAQLDRLPDAAAAAILPLALEFTWRIVVSRKRPTYAGWLSVVATLMFTTGATGTTSLGLMLCVGLFFHGLWDLDRASQALAFRSMLVACGLTALLAAPIWVHDLVHAQVLLAAANPQSPHLQLGGLLGVLSPLTFGNLSGSATEGLQMVNPAADALELVLFPGSIVLFLALLGLLRPKRTTLGLFWITVGGIGLLLSLDGPVSTFAHRLAPTLLAKPGIALLLVHVAFVVLAAASLESFFEAPLARPFAMPLASGLTLLICVTVLLMGFVFPTVGAHCVAALVDGTSEDVHAALLHLRIVLLPTALVCSAIAILFLFWRRIGLMRFKLALETLVVLDLLTIAIPNTPRLEFRSGAPNLAARIPESSGRALLVGRNTPVRTAALRAAGTPVINSTTPAILARTSELLTAIDPSVVLRDHKVRVLPLQASHPRTETLLDIAAVGTVLTDHPLDIPGFANAAPTPATEIHPAAVDHLHNRTQPIPRARIYFDALHVADHEAALVALAKLTANETRLADRVILENSDSGFSCHQPAHPPRVTFLEDDSNTVRIRVAMGDGRGYLVLADAYAPGWRATVDGARVHIEPADVGLRAIPLAEGVHDVTFHYSPWMCRLGLPFALVGALLLLTWLTFTRRVGPKRRW